jgi:hypothetical protein
MDSLTRTQERARVDNRVADEAEGWTSVHTFPILYSTKNGSLIDEFLSLPFRSLGTVCVIII